MSIWTNRPTADAVPPSFRITRTPATGYMRATVLSDTLIGCKLHYFHGRSKPCNGEQCEACKAGQLPRWKGYVFIFSEQSKSIGIFEFTERAFLAFDCYYTEHGTLRGADMRSTRIGKKANSPIEVTFMEGNRDRKGLPAPDDLEGTLMRMWEVTDDAVDGKRTSLYDATLKPSTNGTNGGPK